MQVIFFLQFALYIFCHIHILKPHINVWENVMWNVTFWTIEHWRLTNMLTHGGDIGK